MVPSAGRPPSPLSRSPLRGSRLRRPRRCCTAVASPRPHTLRRTEPELADFPGLEGRRLERLHAVARAALAGRLDSGRLRALEPEAAITELQELPGIGRFYATLIAVRATGQGDALPEGEPRLLASVAYYYGLPAPPDPAAFRGMAEPWRPFRTWACVLLRYSGDRAGVIARRERAAGRRA